MCEKDLQGVFGGYSGNIQEIHSKSLRTQETLPNLREFWEPKGGKTFSIEPESGGVSYRTGGAEVNWRVGVGSLGDGGVNKKEKERDQEQDEPGKHERQTLSTLGACG
ncbi:hypothetical protein [Corynebacterium evansiae]|uniref:hypothetical protein n=1 Tax=Corynebacterium evansiae TaxID=2913499 RepID=UPI003EBD1607